ncbi:MAG TPA: hypothetical protein VGK41_08575 [Solirubrobacterales bacterium]
MALVTTIWSVVASLPAVAVFVLGLGAAAFAFACTAAVLTLWDRWRNRNAPFGATGRNLHSFHPSENVDLIIGTLVVTNRTPDRQLNVEVRFLVPLVDGPTLTAQTIPPQLVAIQGLTYPVLTDSPVVILPEETHSGEFATWAGNREVELDKVVAIVHDLVSDREVEVGFLMTS